MARTVSTSAIWLASALIFIFGFFQIHMTGDVAIFMWFIIGLVLAGGPACATYAIWKSKQ